EIVKGAAAEDLAGADVKHVLEQAPGNLAGDYWSVEEALVIGRENERPVPGQVLFAGHTKAEEDAHDQSQELAEDKPEKGKSSAAVQGGQDFGIVGLCRQDRLPSGRCGARQ